jgi:hypothetical protein
MYFFEEIILRMYFKKVTCHWEDFIRPLMTVMDGVMFNEVRNDAKQPRVFYLWVFFEI